MILKWLQTVIRGTRDQNHLNLQPPNQAPLIDVAHEVLSKEALERKLALQVFEKYGTPLLQKQERKIKIRTKIKSLLRIPLTPDEKSDLVDEITERFAEAAEADPFYRQMFGESEKNR